MRTRDSERDLLVLVARTTSAERDQALAEALARPMDWERLLDFADLHGCIPLLTAALSAPPYRDAVPTSILRRLVGLNAALSLRRQAQLHALTQALAALASAHIHPVLLKGPALAASLYPEPDLRPFQDIDLLLPSLKESRAAALVLRELGYVRCPCDPAEVPGFHTAYALPRRSSFVEIHTDLFQLGLPMRTASTIWDSLESVSIGGSRVRTLGLEHQIVSLCVHLHTHGYGRLIWLKDLDLLLRARGATADWSRIRALSEAEGVTISMRHSLAAVRDLLDTPVPAVPGAKGWNIAGEMAHNLLWPRSSVLALRGKQRLRSVRFNPRQGPAGVIPSLIVMGRRKDKLRAWIRPDNGISNMSAETVEAVVETLSSAHVRGGGLSHEEAVLST